SSTNTTQLSQQRAYKGPIIPYPQLINSPTIPHQIPMPRIMAETVQSNTLACGPIQEMKNSETQKMSLPCQPLKMSVSEPMRLAAVADSDASFLYSTASKTNEDEKTQQFRMQQSEKTTAFNCKEFCDADKKKMIFFTQLPTMPEHELQLCLHLLTGISMLKFEIFTVKQFTFSFFFEHEFFDFFFFKMNQEKIGELIANALYNSEFEAIQAFKKLQNQHIGNFKIGACLGAEIFTKKTQSSQAKLKILFFFFAIYFFKRRLIVFLTKKINYNVLWKETETVKNNNNSQWRIFQPYEKCTLTGQENAKQNFQHLTENCTSQQRPNIEKLDSDIERLQQRGRPTQRN
ncbi:hypothetical protein RFI_34312, partial [Reticulomyxa filosa]